MTDIRYLAPTQAKIAQSMFESTGHNNGNPTVHFRKDGETDSAMVLVGISGPLYNAVQHAVKQLPWVPDSVCVMSDAFSMLPDADSEYTQQIAAGTNPPLSHLFAQGDPRVRESCNTIILTADRTVAVNQTYRWTPVDGWEWDEPVIMDSEEKGNYSTDWEYDRLVGRLPRRDISEFIEREA